MKASVVGSVVEVRDGNTTFDFALYGWRLELWRVTVANGKEWTRYERDSDGNMSVEDGTGTDDGGEVPCVYPSGEAISLALQTARDHIQVVLG